MGENENLAYKQQCIWGFDQYSGEMNFHHRKTQLLKMCSNLMRHLLYWIIPQLEYHLRNTSGSILECYQRTSIIQGLN